MADVMMVVNKGLEIITNRIIGAGSEPKYIHWGTGTTSPAATQTALTAARPEARVAGVGSRTQTNSSNDTYQVVGTLTAEGTAGAITEIGLFDAASGGNMFLRGTFSVINVNPGDSIQFTIQTVFGR